MSIASLGSLALLLALALAPYGALAAVLGHRRGLPELVQSARNALYANAGLLTVAGAALLAAFLSHDFGVRYVASHSSRDMPWYYVVSAFWGGQEGSLLVWAWGLALYGGIVVWRHRHQHPELMPYVVAVLAGIETFFLLILAFVSNPFSQLAFPLPEGRGLNPLLEDPGMLIHPFLLLSAYMSWSIPYAFAMAALLSGHLGLDWIRSIRRYTLTAWALQSLGLLLGAWWAYHVLGWGGYWGWDPVENVAFLPWLTGTAFLHSVMVQERRGMLKIWSLSLVLITFALSIFGTFVVRSGVISSVHSFALSAIGPFFFGFLAGVILFSLGWLLYRLPRLGTDQRYDALLSRESGFLFNNLLLVSLTFTVFWGTIFPILSEAVQGVKITVGPPFYDQVAGPIFLALLFLMGLGPLLAWRRAWGVGLLRNLRWPLAAAGLGVLLAFALGAREPFALAGFAACAFGLGSVLLEYQRGVRLRRKNSGESYPQALSGLVARNRRRYGGYIVHAGIILMALGIIGSKFFQLEREVTLARGESTQLGRYLLTYQGLRTYWLDPRSQVVAAQVQVSGGGPGPEILEAGRRSTRNWEQQPTSLIAIRSTLLEDLYLVLAAWSEAGATATLVAYVNPLVSFLWIGGAVLILGVMVAAWPDPLPRWARASRPAKELVLSEA